ncbi:cytochrome P450 [Penicillium crustosum]|uniref:cytochrome P450 n=1 Tax=Penicillium crustosum TaxID=36656 RepID=UPI00239E106B|nr:cytochrome P450 [Penicillium crustosum]KAJ5393575.1 cytochrome P450 [Penicillium crustosum]
MEIIQLWALLSFILASIAIRTLYRLYFHPLSKFPGPKLAASTHLYEFYFDVVSNGIFLWEIQKMHEKYGPIVRINPRELHINDPHYYDHIYASGGKKRNKDPNFVGLFSAPLSMITTIDHDHHRFRRGILSNFFSKKSVLNMTPLIQEKLAILMERGGILDLTAAFCALTGDIVTHYTYGQSFNSLHEEDFKSNIRGGILELESTNHLNRFVPSIIPLLRYMPSWLVTYFKPATAAIMAEVTEYSQNALRKDNQQDLEKSKQTMVQALSSPALPANERTLSRLQEEGMILLSGGTESPANALSVAAFYLADNISILERLRAELQPVMCNKNFVPLAELEQLPYLTGVVNEALRLSFGLISRPPRIAPEEVLVYREYDIPAGTPVGMSSYFMNMDPTLFPNPESFIPDRWILASERGENLTRFIATFGKGSRACIGMNLGYAELYFTIAAMAHRFKFELHETTQENIRAVRDRGLPFSKDGHWRVKARMSRLTN